MNESLNIRPANCCDTAKTPIAEIHKSIEALNCHVADLVQEACYINRIVGGASEDSIKLNCPPATITEIVDIGLMQNLDHLGGMLTDLHIILDNIENRLGGVDPDVKAKA